jgi:hypothetical protein
VDDFDALAREFLQPAEHFAVFQREAFVGAADGFAFGLRHGLASPAAEALDRLRHVRRFEETVVVRIHDRAERSGVGGELAQLGILEFAASLGRRRART